MSGGEIESGECKTLAGWKNVDDDNKGKTMKDLGKEVLADVIRSRAHVK